MDRANITSPKKGGLSVYGTSVLMNITNTECVKEHVLVHDPTCHACPVACKKEVEIKSGAYAGLRMESVQYEPAWSVGANRGNAGEWTSVG
jgi:aldehyde:ferredoxin oxidoreductase